MRHRIVVLSAATVTVAALGLSGCGADLPPPSTGLPTSEGVTASSASSSSSAPSSTAAPLPPPDALAGVLYQLADNSIPGERKLALVQFAAPEEQPALENFGRALADGGFRQLTVEANDLSWSATPGNVIATVRLGTADDPARTFSFPMEFSPMRDGWQLTRRTADQLLTIGGPPG